jgi:cytidine diphosphoramidate kinase
MVIWIIGMSASGKTTIGKKLYERLTLSEEKWIFLDGDTFRNILGEDLGHSIEDRKKNAYRISRFCEFLSSQKINVVACVLSIFHDNQKYNRDKIKDYKEIYIDVSMENLIARDNKNLYMKALNDEIKDVVGVDIEFKAPYAPDLTIDNNIDNIEFDSTIENIIKEFNIDIEDNYSYTKNNLLEKPHKYQYSLFEGKSFFNKFLKNRNSCLCMLEERLIKLISNNYSFNDIKIVDSYSRTKSIILKDYLVFLLKDKHIDEQEHSKTLNLLIKRFEVSKKLFKSYDILEVRKNTREYDDILSYPLFSLVLQKFFHGTNNDKQKMIYLNSILKLNDILSSIAKDNIILFLEVSYSIEALKGELQITKNYIC